MKKSNWIWIPEWNAMDKDEPGIVYFRKGFSLDKVPSKLEIRISADSRYKLYVNGMLAEIGPCKGDGRIWYYDTVDLTPFLVTGRNILAVVVLRYPLESSKGNASVFRTDTPGLYLLGSHTTENGEKLSLSADETWKCIRDPHVKLLPESPILSHLYIQEKTGGNPSLFGWKGADFQDNAWEKAKELNWTLLRKFSTSPVNLQARPIPYMNKLPRRFLGIQKIRESGTSASKWNRMLSGAGFIVIPPETTEIIEINAGEVMTGFLSLSVTGGKDSEIKILQAESYYLPKDDEKWEKRDRTDSENGLLQGISDIYTVSGIGAGEKLEIYEPFWFRTFRFIRLEITTKTKPLTIKDFSYLETGYPLEVKTKVRTSDDTMISIWEISERTLKRCMHETYIDCPFYEQMQYAMDSRTQILYTYAVSADDRLARKCFADFRRSQRYDGMIACCYPNMNFCIIPAFSIYYILMLHDHMMYFGDKKLIHSYLSTVDSILEYFDEQLSSNGMVNKTGGMLFRHENWSFIDWTEQWDATSGMPPAGQTGPITMESLLYIMGLEHAADMADFAERGETANEYRRRAETARQAVINLCTDSRGMIQDGPGVEQYSQHCQVFALLTDTISVEQGRNNLLKTLENRAEYAQCSVAMAYYLFRGLEKCGLYDYSDQCWDVWRAMVKNNLTTCVEEPVGQRSDCHAWGALALYELPAVILGVRPTKPGFVEMEVKPMPGHFTWAEGEVVTPKGMIKVQWKKTGDAIECNHKLVEIPPEPLSD